MGNKTILDSPAEPDRGKLYGPFGIRGLKVWMSFKRYGANQIGEWIDNNVRQAKHPHSLVAERPEFEAASEPPMSAILLASIRSFFFLAAAMAPSIRRCATLACCAYGRR